MVLLEGKVKLESSVKRKFKIFFNNNLGLENIDIEKAHCSKRKTSSNRPRTIVCNILSYKQKKELLKNAKKLKGRNIFINEALKQCNAGNSSGRK